MLSGISNDYNLCYEHVRSVYLSRFHKTEHIEHLITFRISIMQSTCFVMLCNCKLNERPTWWYLINLDERSISQLLTYSCISWHTPLVIFLYTPYNKHITKWLFWICQKSYKEVSHTHQILVVCLIYNQGFLSQSW